MKVVDAHSGAVISVGQTVDHGDGSSFALLAIKPGILSANMQVRSTYRNPVTGAMTTDTQWVRGPIWYFHAAGQGAWRVAVFPS